jgi:FixJ family two-component response regulator
MTYPGTQMPNYLSWPLVLPCGVMLLNCLYNAAMLIPREREVSDRVASGLMNDQIAAKMSIAQITAKIHCEQVRRKLGAKSLADLVRMADRLRCAV